MKYKTNFIGAFFNKRKFKYFVNGQTEYYFSTKDDSYLFRVVCREEELFAIDVKETGSYVAFKTIGEDFCIYDKQTGIIFDTIKNIKCVSEKEYYNIKNAIDRVRDEDIEKQNQELVNKALSLETTPEKLSEKEVFEKLCSILISKNPHFFKDRTIDGKILVMSMFFTHYDGVEISVTESFGKYEYSHRPEVYRFKKMILDVCQMYVSRYNKQQDPFFVKLNSILESEK